MINFGLIEEWQPEPGHLTSWTATVASTAAAAIAPAHPTPASYQQESYLRAARRNQDAGFRFSRLCLVAFDIQGTLDRDAMTRTVNAFVRRHDTFLSWFDVDDDATVTRHVVDAGAVELEPTDHGMFDHSHDILNHVQDETPGPFTWACMSFGVIEHEINFTFYFAVDHLNSDGVSQALSVVDLIALYGAEAGGTQAALAPAGSYLDYCATERSEGRDLTIEDPRVHRWLSLLRDNDGRLPAFPLALGIAEDGYTRSSVTTVRVFGDAEAQRVEEICKANRAGFTAGVLTVAAFVAHEFTRREHYFGFTPKNTRSTPDEFNSVGWFTNLIPVSVEVTEDSAFTSVVGATQQSFGQGKELSNVSLHRVLELVSSDPGIDIPQGWVVPMVSFIDVRKLPGAAMFDHLNGGVYGNRGSSEEVYLWVNRFPEYTVMSLLYPDTDRARDSIKLYIDRMLEIFGSIASTGDYVPSVAALAR